MKPISLIFLLSLLLLNCSKTFQPGERQTSFLTGTAKEFKLPIKIDSAFIANLDTLEAIDLKSLELLNKDSVNPDYGLELKTGLQACIFIEKIKTSGRYKGYSDSLDIGMIKDATAFNIGKVNLKDGRFLVIWGINEGSFEADPGYSGVTIFASYPNNQSGFWHIVIGQEYFAGDPPAMMQQKTYSEIFEEDIKINTQIISEDVDAQSKITEKKYLKLKMEGGNIEILQKLRVN